MAVGERHENLEILKRESLKQGSHVDGQQISAMPAPYCHDVEHAVSGNANLRQQDIKVGFRLHHLNLESISCLWWVDLKTRVQVLLASYLKHHRSTTVKPMQFREREDCNTADLNIPEYKHRDSLEIVVLGMRKCRELKKLDRA
ncbi:hypothetical protein B296_00039896 [Ensete ventricosum]|nr:hypothetical protein B296_00039896 [Ensete ventricosum]